VDKLGYDGIYGYIVYWILYKINIKIRLLIYSENYYELFLKKSY